MRKLRIDLIVSVVAFQRRFCWQLSSLLQQLGDNCEIVVSVAYIPNEGFPNTQQVCDFFGKQGLNIIETQLDEETIQYRGLARNLQLKKSTADWVLMSDADMVYDPYFFDDLTQQLRGELKDETRCLSASRTSLGKDFCKEYFNTGDGSTMSYPCVIYNVAEKVSQWPLFKAETRNVGAGYFQLANVENIRANHGGFYVKPTDRRDSSWGYRSDRQFRHMLGGICPIKTKPQYHLNHERDNEEGKHITIQR